MRTASNLGYLHVEGGRPREWQDGMTIQHVTIVGVLLSALAFGCQRQERAIPPSEQLKSDKATRMSNQVVTWFQSEQIGFKIVTPRPGEPTLPSVCPRRRWDWGPVQQQVERSDTAELIPAFASALDHPDVKVRYGAVNALKHLGRAAKQSIPELEKALDDSDADVCRIAGFALQDIGPDATPAFIRMLEHQDSYVRRCGAAGMLLTGAQSSISEQAMRQALREDSDNWVRCHSARTLVKWGLYQDAVPALQQLATVPNDAWLVTCANEALDKATAPQGTK